MRIRAMNPAGIALMTFLLAGCGGEAGSSEAAAETESAAAAGGNAEGITPEQWQAAAANLSPEEAAFYDAIREFLTRYVETSDEDFIEAEYLVRTLPIFFWPAALPESLATSGVLLTPEEKRRRNSAAALACRDPQRQAEIDELDQLAATRRQNIESALDGRAIVMDSILYDEDNRIEGPTVGSARYHNGVFRMDFPKYRTFYAVNIWTGEYEVSSYGQSERGHVAELSDKPRNLNDYASQGVPSACDYYTLDESFLIFEP